MPELNTNIPLQYWNLRARFLYNGKAKGDVTYVPCVVFGCSSIQGRAVGFHCMLNNGALIYRLPIHAFVHNVKAHESFRTKAYPLDYLELWDCLSEHVTATEYEFLHGLNVSVLMKDKMWVEGRYLFTLDWHKSSLSDNPGEGGHKCAHVITLQNGQIALQPNNRLKWHDPSFITVPFPERPDYETNDRVWSVENKGGKWHTEDSQRMFYDLEEIDVNFDAGGETRDV